MSHADIETLDLATEGLRVAISSRSQIRGLQDLAARSGHLMISIKNRSFNSRLINGFCRFAETYLAHGYLTIVDKPYMHNVAAASSNQFEHEKKVAGLRRLSSERARQVTKTLSRYSSERLSYLSWDDLTEAVPPWLGEEVSRAFHLGGDFHSAIAHHCRQMVPHYENAVDPDRFEQFMLEETPALLFAYYMLDGGVVDFYPGEIPGFFWDIERGTFESELPQTSKLIRRHPGMIYADISAS